MTNDTLLFAAAQLKKHCKETNCKDCIFVQRYDDTNFQCCRLDTVPKEWDIDDITGESHNRKEIK